MAKYIIRLDDACPTMNRANWDRVEYLLDKYEIKPIVGVIPQNLDRAFDWEKDEKFWERVAKWKNKGWSISVHGLHHCMHYHEPRKGYFQLSHGTNTEFAGVPLEKQRKMLHLACEVFREKQIQPNSFFAPAHTYDENTVKAVSELAEMEFISDGYALRPYKKNGMVFIPSLCDGPFKMLFGIHTFVFHPSVMREKDFLRLEKFLIQNRQNVITTDFALRRVKKTQGIVGILLEYGIYGLRGLRRLVRKA